MNLARALQIFFGIVIAGFGIWIFTNKVSAAGLLTELSACNPLIIGLSMGITILIIWLRALRWAILLPSPQGSNKKGLFSITMIGFMINNILPARAGEAVRVFLLCKRNKFTIATALGSLIIERGIDTLLYILFFCLPTFVLFGTSRMFDVSLVLTLLFIASVVFFIFYAVVPKPVQQALRWITTLLPRKLHSPSQAFITDITSNLNWLFSVKRWSGIIALSLLVNLGYVAILLLLVNNVKTFGILQGMFTAALAALGAAIPLAPGYVGTLHASLKFGLNEMGITNDKAAAIAIIYHAIGYVPVTILGIYYFFKSDMRFRDIDRAKINTPAAETNTMHTQTNQSP